MAEEDASVSNLFKEIDDDLRQDKATMLWKKYGNTFIATIIAIIIAVGAFEAWKSYDLNQRRALGEEYASALELARKDNFAEASSAFTALANKDEGGYSVLSHLQEAGLLSRQGKYEEAAKTYFQISEDQKTEATYRDMALILGALNGLDVMDGAEILKRLQPLIGGTNPWRHSATEISAFAESKLGNKAKAAELMKNLSEDASVPPSMRQRAKEFYEAYKG